MVGHLFSTARFFLLYRIGDSALAVSIQGFATSNLILDGQLKQIFWFSLTVCSPCSNRICPFFSLACSSDLFSLILKFYTAYNIVSSASGNLLRMIGNFHALIYMGAQYVATRYTAIT